MENKMGFTLRKLQISIQEQNARGVVGSAYKFRRLRLYAARGNQKWENLMGRTHLRFCGQFATKIEKTLSWFLNWSRFWCRECEMFWDWWWVISCYVRIPGESGKIGAKNEICSKFVAWGLILLNRFHTGLGRRRDNNGFARLMPKALIEEKQGKQGWDK